MTLEFKRLNVNFYLLLDQCQKNKDSNQSKTYHDPCLLATELP